VAVVIDVCQVHATPVTETGTELARGKAAFPVAQSHDHVDAVAADEEVHVPVVVEITGGHSVGPAAAGTRTGHGDPVRELVRPVIEEQMEFQGVATGMCRYDEVPVAVVVEVRDGSSADHPDS
jgi:hypothetical protein